MDFIVDISVELLFIVGAILLQWCVRHKQATYTLLIILLMIIDAFVWLKLHGKIS